jgi:hypothetical protein
MIWSAILAYLQIFLLPGLALMPFFRRHSTKPQGTGRGLAVVLASFLVNFIVVQGLVVFGLHSRLAWVFVVAVEIIVIGTGLFSKNLSREEATERASPATSLLTLVFWSVLCAALTTKLFDLWGSVWTKNDEILGYDLWAKELSAQHFPSAAGLYGLLSSSLWSISYALARNSYVEFFVRMLPPLLLCLTALYFASELVVHRFKRRSVAALVLVLGSVSLSTYVGSLAWSGYADIPLGLLIALSLHRAWLSTLESDNAVIYENRALAWAAFVVAFLFKPSGVLALPALFWLTRAWRSSFWRGIWSGLVSRALCVLSGIALLANALRWFLTRSSFLASQLTHVTQTIFGNMSYFDRAKIGLQQIDGSLSWRICLLFLCLGASMGAYKNRSCRVIVCVCIVPWIAIFLFFFSYDSRLFKALLPLCIFTSALGLAPERAFVRNFFVVRLPWPRNRTVSASIASLALALLIIVLWIPSSASSYVERQRQANLDTVFPDLNRALVTYFEGVKERPVRVVSEYYPFLRIAPRGVDVLKRNFDMGIGLKEALAGFHPQYLLLKELEESDFHRAVREWEKTGRVHAELRKNAFVLWKLEPRF